MNPGIREIILRIAQKIQAQYHPDKIILFGSYAYGEPTPDSDIDMLIIKDTTERRIDRWVRLKKMVYDPGRGVPFSPLVYTPTEVQERLAMGDDFINEILERGKVLYDGKQGNADR